MAGDQFIKIGDIEGEAQDDTHFGEIDVLSWDWGMTQSGTMHSGRGGGGGKVDVHDLVITKKMDKSTPVLMQMCSNGTQFPEAILTLRKAGTTPLEALVFKMNNVIIASFTASGQGSAEEVIETVTLNFSEVLADYQPQGADGSAEGGTISYGWDIAKNTAL